jgi:hypothetical protein
MSTEFEEGSASGQPPREQMLLLRVAIKVTSVPAKALRQSLEIDIRKGILGG